MTNHRRKSQERLSTCEGAETTEGFDEYKEALMSRDKFRSRESAPEELLPQERYELREPPIDSRAPAYDSRAPDYDSAYFKY